MGDAHHLNALQLRPPTGYYSHAVYANNFVFIAGQTLMTPTGEKLVNASSKTQVWWALSNLDTVLATAGTSRLRLVQIRVYVAGMESHWLTLGALYSAWIGELRPTRAVVPVPMLRYGLAVGIETTAVAG